MTPFRPLAGPLLFAAAGFLFAACGPGGSSAPEHGVVVSQADVERLRIRLLEGLREIDGSLTQLEAQAALVDSTERAAYREHLDALFENRNAIESRITDLAAGPEDTFDILEVALIEATVELDREVEKTHFALAQNVSAVQALSIPRLAILDQRLEDLAQDNGADIRQLQQALREKKAAANAALENLQQFSREPETRAHWQTVVGDRFADLRSLIARAPILQDSIARIPRRDTLQVLGAQAFDTFDNLPRPQVRAFQATPTPTEGEVEEPPQRTPTPAPPPTQEPAPQPDPTPAREPEPTPPPAADPVPEQEPTLEPEPAQEPAPEPEPPPVEVEHPTDPGGDPVRGEPAEEPPAQPEQDEEPVTEEEEYVPTPLGSSVS